MERGGLSGCLLAFRPGGDDNPLWGDEEYARRTRWGGVIAPPTFLYTFSSYSGAMAATGLPGTPALWAEDDWRFHDVVRPGDRIRATFTVAEVVEREGGWGNIHQFEDTIYRRQHPKAFVPDPETGIPDFLMRWHRDEAFAQALGVGGGFDLGKSNLPQP